MITFKKAQQSFLQYLDENQLQKSPIELYEPINYIMGLGGKRVRPTLLLMGYGLFDSEIEKVLPAAYGIELFHNFTLLHDDIMDEAPLRRGKATVHSKYNINTGILSGDAMLIQSYEYIMRLAPHENLTEVLHTFNKVAIEVCEGQQMDMNFETTNDVQIEQYLKMIELKTAVLLAGALKMGALFAGANKEDANDIYQFGRNIGIAFQLQDDILDSYGDPEKFGKKVGGDIIQGKKTYLVLKTFELCKADEKQNFIDLLQDHSMKEEDKVMKVKTIFNSLNIRSLAEKLMITYQDTAFQFLDKIKVDRERKQELRDLANALLARDN